MALGEPDSGVTKKGGRRFESPQDDTVRLGDASGGEGVTRPSGHAPRARRAALVAGLALAAGACGGGSGPPSTVDAIKARGKLVVGIRFEPGLATRNPSTGTYDGFDARIAQAMAVGIFGGSTDTLGNKIEFVDTKLRDRETDIQNGVVDIDVASLTIDDTRKKHVDFAGPYLIDHQDIMVAAGDTSTKSVADLNDKRVCTATGTTSAVNVAAKAPRAQMTLFDTFTECAAALAGGRIDALTTDQTILAGIVAANGGAFKLVGSPFSDEPYGIGLAKGDEAFRSFLNDRIGVIQRNGDWARAFSETLGKLGLQTPSPPAVDRYRSAPTTTPSTVG